MKPRALWPASVAVATFISALLAQTPTGAITGIVADPTQAPVAGAQVIVTSLATGGIVRTQTNSAGVYNAPSLPIGTYELRVETPGFKTYIAQNIVIEVTRLVRVDVTLQLGDVQEKLTVQAQAPLLEPETSSVGTEVTKDLLKSLPMLLGGARRDPSSFVSLTPGATGGQYSNNIAGGLPKDSEIHVDGVPVMFRAVGNMPDVGIPAYDTVAEFRVLTLVPPAEYGRTPTGMVTLVTRSGSNTLNGDILLLLRNNVFDSRRYNASRADITRQAEYSGSIGGPVYIPKLYDGRNKTFFFANYSGYRRYGATLGGSDTVATAAMRAGDFSANPQTIFDPQTGDTIGGRSPFPGNVLPQNRISNVAKALQNAVPLPNLPGLANNFTGPAVAIGDISSVMVKLDHLINSQNKISGNYRYNNYYRVTPGSPLQKLDSAYYNDGPQTKNVTVSEDYFIRPNLTNRVQAAYLHFANNTHVTPSVGVTVPGAFSSDFAGLTFGGQGLNAIGDTAARAAVGITSDVEEALMWTHGKHNFKFGARFDYYQDYPNDYSNHGGTYNFSQFTTSQPGVANTGQSYASFLLGAVNSSSMALALPSALRSKYFGAYVQDDWKVTERLTLNYGLRWEFQVPWFEGAGRASMMDPNLPNTAAGNQPGALEFAGDGPGRIGGRGFLTTYFGNIGPRVGLAYRLTPKTVLRAGFGRLFGAWQGSPISSQGFNASSGISSQNGGLTPVFYLDQGWPAGVVKKPPSIDPTLANGQNVTTYPANGSHWTRTSQFELNIQRMVRNILIDVSYAGTMAHGIPNSTLVVANQVNPIYLPLGPLLNQSINAPGVVAAGFKPPYQGFNGTLAQSLRQFPQYNSVNTFSPTGNSTYDALLVKAEKRLSSGLQFLASYAFSKLLTDQSFVADTPLSGPQDQFNRRAEKSISNTNIPQRLVLSWVYQLPLGNGKPWLNHGLSSRLFGGFSFAAIQTYQSGGPIRVTTPDGLPIFNGSLRPNLVGGVPISIGPGRGDFQPLNTLSGQQGDLYLNRNAFSAPQPYTFGNLGVYLPTLSGFGSMQEDLSASRRIMIREKRSVEFRADFYNAFNRRNLNGPVADLSNPNFGRITGQGNPRSIEFGFRFDF
jgi:hypothetical protein